MLRPEALLAKCLGEDRSPKLGTPCVAKCSRGGCERGPGREYVVDDQRPRRRRVGGADSWRRSEALAARAPDLAAAVAARQRVGDREREPSGDPRCDRLRRIEATAASAQRRRGNRDDRPAIHQRRDRPRDRLGSKVREADPAAELERGDQFTGHARVRSRPGHAPEPGENTRARRGPGELARTRGADELTGIPSRSADPTPRWSDEAGEEAKRGEGLHAATIAAPAWHGTHQVCRVWAGSRPGRGRAWD